MNYAIIRPEGNNQTVTNVPAAPELAVLQGAVVGYIETVPFFTTYEYEGRMWPCVAYCNEEGKLDGLPVNVEATILWEGACAREGVGRIDDVLVGSIIVIFGEPEELAEL